MLNFAEDRDYFKDERVKTLTILRCLGGEVYLMNIELLRKFSDHPNNPEDWGVQTSRELLQRSNKQYETIDLAHDAALKFDDLFQDASQFQDFLAVFTSLAIKSKKSEAPKVDALKTKVSTEIVLALKKCCKPTIP
ncbi:hypothetical protein K3495_g5646 [Podosphaera aphanis]|nr:hypothetical protein K3495_g5646 [Podosphaera aphanis]